MVPNSSPPLRAALTDQILDLYSRVFDFRLATQEHPLLRVELTMPQVKALLVVVDCGQASGSQLARSLGVGLPSVTRLIDRLEQHGLIARREDAEDRRVTWILPTVAGQQLVESLDSYKREALDGLLAHLGVEQLHEVQRAFTHLVQASATHQAVGSKQ